MTLNELEESIKTTCEDSPLVHIRLGFVEVKTSLLLDAVKQIKTTVSMCACGVEDPKMHRAEALLLMILDQASYHGYTPREAPGDV